MATSAEASWSEQELRDKVGQLFIVGFHGLTPSEDIKTLITTHKVGAIILFSRNIADASQLFDLTRSLQDIARQAGHKHPLSIAIDQENGLVTRLKSPLATQLLGSMALGATGDVSNAYKVALATAETLKAFGINMNYAPIADVNSEPNNPVIGVRSPSDDPETVGRFVSAQVRGLKEGRVIPCVKHFPGHGDTAVDSHYGLPIISKSKEELDSCELVPFRRAVVEGVDSVMTAHIALPGLGGDGESKSLPASLNPVVIDILRNEMKYDGVVISDCLEMDGVRTTFGTEKGAVMALKAGSDCVMVCHTMSAQVGAIERVIEATKAGEILQSSIEGSVARIGALKLKYLSTTEVLQRPSLASLDERNRNQTKLAAEIYARSTTLVRSAPGMLPIPTGSNKKIVFIDMGNSSSSGGVVKSGAGSETATAKLDTYISVLQRQDLSLQDLTSQKENLEKVEADVVIVATKNARLDPPQREYVRSLGRLLGDKLIVIATCDPYDFLDDPETIKNYITMYEPTIPAFNAAINVVFGVTTAGGSLPVGVPADQHIVRELTTSDKDINELWALWQTIFPKWQISLSRMEKILLQPHGRHYIHEKGFCLSFLMDGIHGKIAAVGVLPDFRGKGLGTLLVNRAKADLRARSNEAGKEIKTLAIGSVFPRLWCEIPVDFPQQEKDFFLHRGFRHPKKPTARDLFRDIRGAVAPPAVLERVSKLNLKFSPWSPSLYDECMIKQRANFKNIGWVEAYERLAEAGQHHEVMVAFDPITNAQIGWTLMCSLDSVVSDDFAFLPLMPSKEKTGLIACVGVDKDSRGKGVGLALLVKAMENMRERGIEGVCIDWVVIRGFYETLGFEVCWEYEGYEW